MNKEERIIRKSITGDWMCMTIPPRKFVSNKMWKAINDSFLKEDKRLSNIRLANNQ